MSSIASLQIGQNKISVLNLPDLDNAVDITEQCTYTYNIDNFYSRYYYVMPQTGYIRVYGVSNSSEGRIILDYGDPSENKFMVNLKRFVIDKSSLSQNTAITLSSSTPILKGYDFRVDCTNDKFTNIHIYFYPLK